MSNEDGSSEFGSMAAWTAEAVRALGRDHAVPAACRGSGGPGALDWFAARLPLRRGDVLVDVGAGVGGPAQYAAVTLGVLPVLFEPMAEACRASVELFGRPTAVAAAEDLPCRGASVGAAWCLGVLCTVSDQAAGLREIARILAPRGRCGLLVYERQVAELAEEPDVNHFPRPDALEAMVDSAGLAVVASTALADVPSAGTSWSERADVVDAWIEDAHGHTAAWVEAHEDERTIGRLLDTGQVAGRLMIVTRT